MPIASAPPPRPAGWIPGIVLATLVPSLVLPGALLLLLGERALVPCLLAILPLWLTAVWLCLRCPRLATLGLSLAIPGSLLLFAALRAFRV